MPTHIPGHQPTRGLLGQAPRGQPRGVAPETDFQGQANVTDAEQQEYDLFMDRAFQLMYDEKVLPNLLERMKQSGNPVEGLASTTVHIVRRLVDSARRQGKQIDPAVLLHGGSDVLADLAMVAGKAGVHDYTDEEIENAAYAAVDMFGTEELERGTLDKDAIARDFQDLIRANEQGRIDELVPGLSDKARQIQSRGGGNVRG